MIALSSEAVIALLDAYPNALYTQSLASELMNVPDLDWYWMRLWVARDAQVDVEVWESSWNKAQRLLGLIG